MNFVVLADCRVKLKESEKRDKYLDLARELKNLWNMKVTVILIVIGALGTVIKGLEDLKIISQCWGKKYPLIRHNKIANVDYTVTEMKPSIT